MKKICVVIFLLASSIYLLVSPAPVHADGLSVTPQIQTLDLRTDPPIATLTYKNTTPVSIQLDLSVVDFKNVDEIGTPELINPSSSNNYKYGLSSWVKLASNNIVLQPGEDKTISIDIQKERLSQGGHYAAVLAEIKQGDDKKDVRLKGMFAALLMVRADSKYNREEGKISSFIPNSNLLSFPDNYILRFQNTGNIDVTPHGLIEIHDMLGRLVARGIVNENSLISLPETIRKYNIPLKNDSTILLPGIYKANLSLHYGDKDEELSADTIFIYLGWYSIILFVLVCIVGVVLFNKLKGGNNKAD